MTELWNWRIDQVRPVEVYPALAEALGRVVMPLAIADPARLPAYAVVCDVWQAPGEFATIVDCYGVPDQLSEHASIAALARLLDRNCLLRDDTLDAGRHLLVSPDGTIRPVHFDVRETDDGEELRNQRLCTEADPAAAAGPSVTAPGGPPTRSRRRSRRPDRRAAPRPAHDELVEQGRGGLRHGGHRRLERGGVVRGGRTETGDLPDVLQRRGPDVLVGHLLGVRLTQGLDAPAHGSSSVPVDPVGPDTLSWS